MLNRSFCIVVTMRSPNDLKNKATSTVEILSDLIAREWRKWSLSFLKSVYCVSVRRTLSKETFDSCLRKSELHTAVAICNL